MTQANLPFPPSTSPDPAKSAAAKKPLAVRSPVLAHLRKVFFAGMLTAIPLFITVSIVTVLYNLITKFTKSPADWLVDELPFLDSRHAASETLKTITSPILAVMLSLFAVYLLGLLGSFFIGRQILAQAEHFISNLPLIKGIYGTTKQVMAVFRQGGGGAGFQRVVLVEFPRRETWTLAFVTNTVHDATENRRMICCFIPMTPNPTSGFFQMFPEDQVRNTDWSVDMGIKIVLSGGMLAPQELSSEAVKEIPPAPSSPPQNQ